MSYPAFDPAAAGATPPPVPHSALVDLGEFNRIVAQAQRLEAVSRLSAGVAHDFNNLLTVIIGLCEVWLAKTGPTDPIREDLREMSRNAERAAELTRHLSTFARARPQEARPVQVVERLKEMDRLLRRLLGEGIRLTVQIEPLSSSVVVDSGQLDQVLVHLAARAGEVTPTGGEIRLACAERVLSTGSLPSGKYVEIALTDGGPPLTPEDLGRLFDPSAPQAGGLVRLGPAWCREFALQHGGDLMAESAPGAGTTLRLILPAAPKTAHPAIGRDTTVSSPRGSETILVVEDDPGVRKIAVSALKQNGYQVLDASTPELALAASDAAPPHSIQLLVTDLVLPGMGGPSVLRKARARHPDLRVLYISGYGEDAPQLLGVGPLEGPVLAKPFSLPRFLRRVRSQLDGRAPAPGGTP